MSPARAAPHRAVAGPPRRLRRIAVGAPPQARGKRRPGEIAAPVATGSRETASSGAIPPGLGKRWSRVASGGRTIPGGGRVSHSSHRLTLEPGVFWRALARGEPRGSGPLLELQAPPASLPAPVWPRRACRPDPHRPGHTSAGKQTKRSFHSHRPTHGISDSPPAGRCRPENPDTSPPCLFGLTSELAFAREELSAEPAIDSLFELKHAPEARPAATLPRPWRQVT